jgi:hypothetical protein
VIAEVLKHSVPKSCYIRQDLQLVLVSNLGLFSSLSSSSTFYGSYKPVKTSFFSPPNISPKRLKIFLEALVSLVK